VTRSGRPWTIWNVRSVYETAVRIGTIGALLYSVHPTDPQTFGVVTVALAATALLACCVPALKVAFVDPAIALRYE
jgi:ABC-type lipoprotein release transport system permease subunit